MDKSPDVRVATALEISALWVGNILCKNNFPTLI